MSERADGVRPANTDAPGPIAGAAPPAAAFFDVDGTLLRGTIVHYYVYFRRRLMPRWVYPLWYACLLAKVPYFLLLDKCSRTRFNRAFYRSYRGLDAAAVRALADDCFRDYMRPHLYEESAARVAGHRAAGRRVVLLTGSLDFVVAPLARHLDVDDVLAPSLVEEDGRFTGALDGPPLVGGEKGRRAAAVAEQDGIDLRGSYAYADSIDDLSMLDAVGRPVAVNPDPALRARALERGWDVEDWTLPAV